ncbi:uncharacterized protein LOC131172973 [Hevea brasiliensis]|uniref:uncharacterized protein LOC131172973 n=1 Tax=Hevea brasiliensis TaxID=3981 RepID=UPI0025F6190F|nr:uncharacterized protein LOC131172973 [Hevea brasiliensis]
MRDPAAQASGQPVQLQQFFFQQMIDLFRQMTRVIPQAQPLSKFHLEKLRKYRAVDFKEKKEDDPAAIEKSLVTLRAVNAHWTLAPDGAIVAELEVKPSSLQQIQKAQKLDERLVTIIRQIQEGKDNEYEIKRDGHLYYKGKIYVLNDEELKRSILKEAHRSFYTMHPGSTKMCRDLKTYYW